MNSKNVAGNKATIIPPVDKAKGDTWPGGAKRFEPAAIDLATKVYAQLKGRGLVDRALMLVGQGINEPCPTWLTALSVVIGDKSDYAWLERSMQDFLGKLSTEDKAIVKDDRGSWTFLWQKKDGDGGYTASIVVMCRVGKTEATSHHEFALSVYVPEGLETEAVQAEAPTVGSGYDSRASSSRRPRTTITERSIADGMSSTMTFDPNGPFSIVTTDGTTTVTILNGGPVTLSTKGNVTIKDNRGNTMMQDNWTRRT